MILELFVTCKQMIRITWFLLYFLSGIRYGGCFTLTATKQMLRPLHRDLVENLNARALSPPPPKSGAQNIVESVQKKLRVLWQFSRPHTVVGTTAAALSLFCYATPPREWISPRYASEFAKALIPSLLINIYITGLNQIIDQDIDRVNKPYLPIASGDMSQFTAEALVSGSLLSAYALISKSEPPLRWMVNAAVILGTLYSLPPFRLKRFPLLAALCIILVRGAVVNLGFYNQVNFISNVTFRVKIMHQFHFLSSFLISG